MDKQLALEIIDCLPKERSLYSYYKDYYSLQLLEYFVGEGKKITDIRQSRYGKLLTKPVVKKMLAECGGNQLFPQNFERPHCNSHQFFSLTLDLWNASKADWTQTSRRGWNLVLQLNFSNQHNSQYRKLVKPVENQVLNASCHPVFRGHGSSYFRETLAWARLDVDFDRDECLIEEIQSDWIRDARYLLSDARIAKKYKREKLKYWPVEGRLDDVIEYCQFLEQQYTSIWAEAMLSAVLFFVKSELGLKQVYYHSSQSGAQIKNIRWTKPPRSLYSTLPRSFCFSKTNHGPQMLRDDVRYKRLRRKLKTIHWFELSL